MGGFIPGFWGHEERAASKLATLSMISKFNAITVFRNVLVLYSPGKPSVPFF